MPISDKQFFNRERSVLWLSFIGTLLFVICEVAFAIISSSRSVLMDAAYDITELLATFFMLVLTPYLYSPPTEKRPYGFAQAESLFVFVKGVLMLVINGSLAINTLRMALSGGNSVDGGQVAIFEVVLAILGITFFFLVSRASRGLSSSLLDTVLYGWKLNACYSCGMAAAFFASFLLGKTSLSFIIPYVDPIVAIVAFIFLLPDALKLIWRAIRSIFLFAADEEVCAKVKYIAAPILAAYGFSATHYDIISTGRRLWISVYFSAGTEYVDIHRLSELNALLNAGLQEEIGDCYSELIPDTHISQQSA